MAYWWQEKPLRIIQTNLRQIDMKDMDADRYVKDLVDFGANGVFINTAGILASYPTSLPYHFQSEYLTGDSLKMMIDKCHENGIRVVARTDFSKIRRPIFEAHPEWAYRTVSGDIVDYNGDVHACLNGGFQSEYLFKIITEVLETLRPDAIFCNMGGFQVKDYSYNYHGICHCDSCKKKFDEMFHLPLPEKEDMSDPVFRKYMLFKKVCVAKHSKRLYDHVKAFSPDIAVYGFDLFRHESNTEYGRPLPHWQYDASSNTRYMLGTDDGFVAETNTTVDFIGFYYRQVAVSATEQKLRSWQAMANNGGLDFYLMGRIDNHLDRSGFAGVKEVFHFHKAHDRFFWGLRSKAEVLLLRDAAWQDKAEVFGWIRALTEAHIPFSEILAEHFDPACLKKFKAVILPDIRYLSDEAVGGLDAFAKAGGVVISAGQAALYDDKYEKRENTGLACLGVEKLRCIRGDVLSSMMLLDDKDKELFTSFTDTDLVALGKEFLFADYAEGAKTYGKYIPPHPMGPPERCYFSQVTALPCLAANPCGKGLGVHIPWYPGTFYYKEGHDNSFRFMRDILLGLAKLRPLARGLTPMVEVTVASHGDEDLVVQLVNTSGHFGTSYFEPLPVPGVTLTVPTAKAPAKIQRLTTGEELSFTMEGDAAVIPVGTLGEYEGVVLSF